MKPEIILSETNETQRPSTACIFSQLWNPGGRKKHDSTQGIVKEEEWEERDGMKGG